jgi:hypothetical protein
VALENMCLQRLCEMYITRQKAKVNDPPFDQSGLRNTKCKRHRRQLPELWYKSKYEGDQENHQTRPRVKPLPLKESPGKPKVLPLYCFKVLSIGRDK